jgi:murein tripeptide amidase MpaA
LGDSKASTILREIFIFQIIPMLNPDGVEHGNFRFDH